jgi:hypothetical protein
MGDVMWSLAVFGIVGDTHAGLSSTARDSLGVIRLLREFITTIARNPHVLFALLFLLPSHLTSDTRC